MSFHLSIPTEIIKNKMNIIDVFSTSSNNINGIMDIDDCNNSINNMDIDNDNHNFKTYINLKLLNTNIMPQNLSICTISTSGSLNCKLNLENISNYMNLYYKDIISIKYNKKIRSLDPKYIEKHKKKNKKFNNQLTLVIIISFNKNKKGSYNCINVKLFSNGSFQMTGCKSIYDANIAINKLINRLSHNIAIFNKTYNVIEDKPYIKLNDIYLNDIKVCNFKVDMINTNFNVDYKINRQNFYNYLKKYEIRCSYNPAIHSCVNIKYKFNNKDISILVFQTGSILITGAKTIEEIEPAYNYINQIFCNIIDSDNDIVIYDNIMEILDVNDIMDIMNNYEHHKKIMNVH